MSMFMVLNLCLSQPMEASNDKFGEIKLWVELEKVFVPSIKLKFVYATKKIMTRLSKNIDM